MILLTLKASLSCSVIKHCRISSGDAAPFEGRKALDFDSERFLAIAFLRRRNLTRGSEVPRRCTCKRCGHQWQARAVSRPRQCPTCWSRHWSTQTLAAKLAKPQRPPLAQILKPLRAIAILEQMNCINIHPSKLERRSQIGRDSTARRA